MPGTDFKIDRACVTESTFLTREQFIGIILADYMHWYDNSTDTGAGIGTKDGVKILYISGCSERNVQHRLIELTDDVIYIATADGYIFLVKGDISVKLYSKLRLVSEIPLRNEHVYLEPLKETTGNRFSYLNDM